jgi:hypothetical protein
MAMTLLNSLINTSEELQDRVERRAEFVQLGITPIMEVSAHNKLHKHTVILRCCSVVGFYCVYWW